MTKPVEVLVVDDDAAVREALVAALQDEGYFVRAADGVQSAWRLLAEKLPDAALLDIRLRDGDGLQLLSELRSRYPQLPVIMATAYGDSSRTIAAMRSGAFEYVTKPFDLGVLFATVARAARTPVVAQVASAVSDSAFIGASPGMLAVWKAIGRAAACSVPVLITGESGVGKELVARAIHEHGLHRSGRFVAVNLAALPASLIESELFGHEKGAFTGATARREGRFELAHGGTLFLDEIGDLELSLQSKLLRVLEDGTFERVGGSAQITSLPRIVAATSRPVTPGTPGSTLREDLFYRLGVLQIEVPPLRKRRQDIPLLVAFFLRQGLPRPRAISEAAMQLLTDCDWPGNVRQLRHVLERACAMSAAEVIDVQDLELPQLAAKSERTDADSGELDLKRAIEQVERQLITRALMAAEGNRTQAARLLGIRRALLYTRIKELELTTAWPTSSGQEED